MTMSEDFNIFVCRMPETDNETRHLNKHKSEKERRVEEVLINKSNFLFAIVIMISDKERRKSS
jgi:hypothetical protein